MVDNQREKTMRERLGDRASSLVNNTQYLPMIRARQKAMEPEEFAAAVEIAHRAEKPSHYFMSMMSKKNFERTLQYVRRILKRSVEAMSYVARKINNRTKSFMNYIGDKIAEGKYPMSQVVNMVEISCSKKQPDRYLIGILKKGYENAAPKVRS
jgi:hypothetical protein